MSGAQSISTRRAYGVQRVCRSRSPSRWAATAPIGQAAAVDPFGPARLLQRPIRRLLPRLAGRVQPIPGLGRPALARPALRRSRGVVPLEPLLLAARDPVIAALRDRQEAIL